jgi:hypothetical protein
VPCHAAQHLASLLSSDFSLGAPAVETSAKTGQNVEEAFLKTAQLIYQNVQDGNVDVGTDGGVTKRTNVAADPVAPKSDCAC